MRGYNSVMPYSTQGLIQDFLLGGESISSIAYSGFDGGFFCCGGGGKHIDCMIVYDECE